MTDIERQLELAWCAGFFDGEGCVGMYLRGGSADHFLTAVAYISNNDRRSILRVHAVSGGTVREVRRGHYRAAVCGKDAEAFLRAIHPYTTTKHEQISVFLTVRGMGHGARLTDAEYERRAALVARIAHLKRAA